MSRNLACRYASVCRIGRCDWVSEWHEVCVGHAYGSWPVKELAAGQDHLERPTGRKRNQQPGSGVDTKVGIGAPSLPQLVSGADVAGA